MKADRKAKLKNWFVKTKFYIKKYWYLLLAGIVGIVTIVLLKKSPVDSLYGSLMARYRQTLEESKADLQQTSNIRQEEQKTEARLNQQYEATVQVLRDKHDLDVDSLTEVQRVEIRNILVDSKGSPEAMARKVSTNFGIPQVSRTEDKQ